MKFLIGLVVLILVGGALCKPDLWLVGQNKSDSSSSSSEEDSSSYRRSTVISPEMINSVELFMAKVVSRLDKSTILANQPEIKRRMLEIAAEKFKSCETLHNLNEERNHRSCLGAATGHMMSLISSYEHNQNINLLN